VHGKSAFLFPAGDDQALGQVLLMVKSNPSLVHSVALEGASLARNLLARDAVVGFGDLLERVLDFTGEGQLPRSMIGLEEDIPQGWRWDFIGQPVLAADNSMVKDLQYLQSATDLNFVGNASGEEDSDREDLETSVDEFDLLNDKDWTQEKQGEEMDTWEQLEEEMVCIRGISFSVLLFIHLSCPQSSSSVTGKVVYEWLHSTGSESLYFSCSKMKEVDTSFEEVNKMVKKTETRVAQDKHLEVNHFDIERVSQPLCIYEPYHGAGSWKFLHRDLLLYQGLSLVWSLAPFALSRLYEVLRKSRFTSLTFSTGIARIF
jgi:hypothetical protein